MTHPLTAWLRQNKVPREAFIRRAHRLANGATIADVRMQIRALESGLVGLEQVDLGVRRALAEAGLMALCWIWYVSARKQAS